MFSKLFRPSDQGHPVPWLTLDQPHQIEQIIARSFVVPVAVFKHSTRCGVSRMVLSGLERTWDIRADELEPYFLDLLQHRDVSDVITERSGIRHESPQLILFRQGEVIYHASHQGIDLQGVRQLLDAA